MEKHTLKVEKRTVIGKKIKSLRNNGLIPANVYGKGVKSESIQTNLKEFLDLYKKAGESTIIELQLAGSEPRHTLIRNVQKDPVSGMALHVDFYQVSLKEKITAKVPIVPMGESKAVADKVGVIMQPLAEVEIEALPTDLPEKIEVDVSKLSQIDEQILVKDLPVDKSKITVLTGEDEIVVKVGSLISEEAKKLAEEEAAAKAAAEATAAPIEGAAPTEGATPTETQTEQPVAKEEAAKPEAK